MAANLKPYYSSFEARVLLSHTGRAGLPLAALQGEGIRMGVAARICQLPASLLKGWSGSISCGSYWNEQESRGYRQRPFSVVPVMSMELGGWLQLTMLRASSSNCCLAEQVSGKGILYSACQDVEKSHYCFLWTKEIAPNSEIPLC